MGMAAAVAWPYKVLSREHHQRLVADLQGVARQAGVPAAMLDRSMQESGCTLDEVKWFQHYRAHTAGDTPGGMIYVGKEFKPAPLIRMQAMAAAFLRNYIDARIVMLMDLVPDEDGEAPDPRVLFVPNFHSESTTGGAALTNWQFQYIQGLLMKRLGDRRGTVLHVDDMALLRKDYGKSFHDFLVDNWSVYTPD